MQGGCATNRDIPVIDSNMLKSGSHISISHPYLNGNIEMSLGMRLWFQPQETEGFPVSFIRRHSTFLSDIISHIQHQ